MQKTQLSLFSLILTSLYPVSSWANLDAQCLAGVPHFTGEIVAGDPNEQPIYIEANTALLTKKNHALYQGDVQIRQGNRYLHTEKAEVEQIGENERQRRVTLTGDFNYQDNFIYLLGGKAQVALNQQSADISQGVYQLVDRQGRGQAEEIILEPNYRLLKHGTFTTCLPENNSWRIEGTEMKQYVQEEYAEIWNARFHVGDVPIFYLPYLQFPLGDRRRSGLLIPTYGTGGRNGYWFSQPIYWNIAPNMDATFTPKYMSKRGWQGIGEYRLLTHLGQTIVAGEYLNRDRYKDFNKDTPRYLFYLNHQANLNRDWRLAIDYTRVSDSTYFDDFDSLYGKSTDGYANQSFKLSYHQPHYDIELSALQFQLFGLTSKSPYRTLPKLNYHYYRDGINDWLDFQLFSQAVQFKNDDDNLPSTWRLHLEPSLALPLMNRYGRVKFETKLYATRYWQKAGQGKDHFSVQSHVNRVIPEFKVGVDTLLAKNYVKGYTQTIEPHIGYMYRSFRNQAMIGIKNSYGYDSSEDYNGLDRILSANQISTGATTRFYDEQGEERFNFRIDQTYYFQNEKAELERIKNRQGSSDWALTSNYHINRAWNFYSHVRYKADYHRIANANASIQWRPSEEHLLQLSYRHINRNELQGYGKDIKQLGLTASVTLRNQWAMVGKNYYDFALKKPVEQFVGLQYSTCCYAIALGMSRYVETQADQRLNDIRYNNSFTFRFELRGFGAPHSSGVRTMLDQGKLPFIEPFNL